MTALTDEEAIEYQLLMGMVLDDRERVACEGSLIEFLRCAWPHIGESGTFEINWHHDVIASYLEAVARGEVRALIDNQPPRTTKSLLCSVAFPAWVWAQPEAKWGPLMGPHVKFFCLSYGATLAEEIAVKMRRLVQGEWYQRHWGSRVQILEDQKSRTNFGNTAGGERLSNSIEGGLLGRGGDIQLVDDPHHTKGVESLLMRQGTIDGMRSLSTRITDPRRTARVLIMQRLHQCLLPGVPVRTPQGETAIEMLRVGDIVLGSDGWQPIEAVGSRPHDGEAVSVRLFGHPAVCKTTPDHHYLTKRGWVEAGSLSTADWVRFPVATPVADGVPWDEPRVAQPPQAPSGSFNGERRATIDRVALGVLVAEGRTNTAIAAALGVHRNTIQCYLWLYGIGRIRDRNPIFGVDHLRQPLFWRIVGYWLAEGCFMKGSGLRVGIRFTFNIAEREYIDEISSFFSVHSISVKEHDKPDTNVCQLEVNCSQLGRWFSEHFGSGARWKTLPEFVFGLPPECRVEILEGWLRGDGCYRRTGGLIGMRSGTSSSLALVQGMQRLALSLGMRAMVVTGNPRELPGSINGQSFVSRRSWEMRLPTPAKRQGSVRLVLDSGGAWYRVRSVAREAYAGLVHDITTASHDFVVGNATVHNSDATDYALKNWGDDLVHLCFPMRFEADRACFADTREREGDLLWPEVFTEDAVAQMEKELLEYGSAGQLQQRPIPRGGGIIKREWLQPWPPWNADGTFPQDMVRQGRIQIPALEYVVAWVDTAYTEKQQNDPSAMVVLGVFRAEGKGKIEPRGNGTFVRVADDYGFPKVLLLYGWQKRLTLHGPPEEIPLGVSRQEWASPRYRPIRQENWGLVEWVADTVTRYKVDYLGIETQAAGHSLDQELRRVHADLPCSIETQPAKGDKWARLYSVSGLFSSGQIYVPTFEDGTHPIWAEPLITELVMFPRAEHDEAVDVFSGALKHLRETAIFERREEFDRGEQRAMSWETNRRVQLPYDV